ncbi:MAG: (Fe-S)-binding protein [Proteobacteria bacterium]|nr:(Fe-S)-binding protein [Pseudomonadota bacterium]
MFKAEQCTVCGECLTWCPYMEMSEEEARREFRKLIDGESTPVAAQCVSCMGCDEICPERANPFSLIIQRQEEQGEFNRFPEAKARMELAYSLPSEVRPGAPGGPVIDLCTVSPMTHWLFDGALFEGATFLMGGDYYCGIGFYHVGLSSPVEAHAAAVVDRVARTGAREVVCYHDDCYTLYKAMAPEFGIDVPFEPISWPEFLYRRMKALEDRIRPLNRPVAYQRPCASRYTPEKDPFVDRLFELIGAPKPARSYEGENAFCCGGGIVPRDYELSNRIKHQNLKDARDAGAEIMVTLCPMCFMNLKKRAPQHGLALAPISDLCRAALGEIEIG